MSVTFDDLIGTSISEEIFLQFFRDSFFQHARPFSVAYQTILTACYRNPILAPNIKANNPEKLTLAWLKRYTDSYENRISRRISKPIGTIADPIVSTIVSARLPELTAESLEQIKYAHRLSMSAENIQGLLLEEFLAINLVDYGWHCCWGDSIRHVDFCNVDGSLLQIKNRSNSENSSSSRVRINRPIEKWYRVDAKTGYYRWHYFNEKYNTNRFSEENFSAFVIQVLCGNPRALFIELDNPWQTRPDLPL